MGLDMYLDGRICFMHDSPEEIAPPKIAEIFDLGCWHRHPSLHGYIVRHFADGIDECREIPLSRENILQIIRAVCARRLPRAVDLVFGESEQAPKRRREDVRIFREALAWLEAEEPDTVRSVSYHASS